MLCAPPANGGSAVNFAPFDCSGIYWNNAAPLPQPESEVIDKATALLATVNSQLHPSGADQKVNPQLASAIEKSGMILLDDFSDIVLKTQNLCRESDCVRLKNALVNLATPKLERPGETRQSGALQGVNVLLRPVSAESLESLTKVATSSFIFNETRLAAAALNSPPPGGFLISSDEGRQLVSHPQPSAPQSEYNALDQWNELQRLSTLLLHTPSGTGRDHQPQRRRQRHPSCGAAQRTGHDHPMALPRYQSAVAGGRHQLGYNARRLVQRRRINQHRVADIQRYYDSCFNPQLNPMSMRPMA